MSDTKFTKGPCSVDCCCTRLLAAIEGWLDPSLDPVDGFGPHVMQCEQRKAAAWKELTAAIKEAKGET